MKPVEILTVKGKIQLYKGEEKANAIELIQLEEVGFEIVSQKDLYQIGDKVVYIQPDYCLPENSLFESFIKPGGDPKKSKLGSKNRIRAVKFNLHKGDNEVIYSQGILMPLEEVVKFLNKNDYTDDDLLLNVYSRDLVSELQITKWEEPEDNSGSGVKGGKSKPFPEGMYKTDEDNINNLWNKIQYPIELIGTEKIDGSSITLYVKNGIPGICSRNLDKPLTSKSVVGRRTPKLLEKVKIFFGKKIDLNIYDEVPSDSDFVKYGKPYLDKLVSYYKDFEMYGLVGVSLRGELNGKTLKGSGNKNNPSVKEEPNIKFFGLDFFVDRRFRKAEEENFEKALKHMGLENSRCKVVFKKVFNNREEIEKSCMSYFKKNMIEGIVLRNLNSSFSAKFMNPEYDSKK